MTENLRKVVVTKENLNEYIKDLEAIYFVFNEYYRANKLNYEHYQEKESKDVDFKKDILESFEPEEVYCDIYYNSENKPVACVLGFIEDISIYFAINKVGYCDSLFVDESLRGAGLGTKMLADFGGWCKSKNITVMRLDVKSRNEKAIAFYRSLGFEIDLHRMFKKI